MTSTDGRGSGLPRWLVPAGIALAAVAALGILVLARRPSPPVHRIEISESPRSRAEKQQHLERLAEVHRIESETFAAVPLAEQSRRIDEDPTLTAEERARKKKDWQEAVDAVHEAELSTREIRREFQEYALAQKQNRAPAKEEEKKATLRLVLDAASTTLLPWQSLVANLSLIN